MTNEEIAKLVEEWTEHVRSQGFAWRGLVASHDADVWPLIHNAILGAVHEALGHDAALGYPVKCWWCR